MKGMKCKCKYATVSSKTKCPRCGRQMNPAEWPDEGKLLSFTELRTIPEGFENRYDMALVMIENGGPKVICWTTEKPKVGDLVTVSEWKGKYLCALKVRP